ncbi:MAG: zinc-ribbon domain-containing protein [Rubrivivax sp.]|jgi:predicted Zn finger-like uncharacterized protein|nr:zinc-ribbon domain-containing protein [Rubrivivax sp.]
MSSLATRCSACGTVFRVVPDQLRVSEGWVRCGRCSQVFNALESLVDLETGLPRREGGFGPASGFEGSNGMPLDVAQPAARPGAPALPPSPPSAPTPALPALPNAADQLARDFASTSAPETRPPHTSELLSPAPPSVFGADAGDDSDPGALRADPAQKPSFVRQADRAARWRRPGVRAALAGVALLASAGLAGQLAYTWRDRLAAKAPVLAPLLAQGCEWLGCELGPARQIDALSVESSGLVRVERSNLYKLQVSLRNRAPHPVAAPALDLTLTDARGELIARRVLRLPELGETAATIPPGRDLALQTTLQAAAVDGAPRVIAGYTVELFYP